MARVARLFMLLIALLAFSGCGGPAPATEESDQEPATQPAASAAATAEDPTVEPTLEPTATPQALPQPISAANAAGLTLTGLMELPRQPELVSQATAPGIVGGYTPDGQFLALRTAAGVDVLNPADLSLVASYPGALLNILLDGRMAVAQGGRLVYINPATGETEDTGISVVLNGRLQVSATGAASARLVGGNRVELTDLASGTVTELAPRGNVLIHMFFNGTGTHLLLGDGNMVWVYDAASGAEVFARQSYQVPVVSGDGQYLIDKDFNSLHVIDIATGDILNSFAGGYQIERGCGAETCVDHLAHLVGYYVPGDVENAIVFWQQSIGRWNVGENATFDDYTYSTDVGIQNLLTAELKFSFPGYQIETIVIGLAAPDGSNLLMINRDGSVYLHSLADGSLLTSSDYYTVGGQGSFSPDGGKVAWSNLVGLYVYDIATAGLDVELPAASVFAQTGAVQWLANGLLATEGQGAETRLDFWDAAAGTVTATEYGLTDCKADRAGLTLICMKDGLSQRIIKSDAPASVLFASDDLGTFTVLSPLGDGYASCILGAATITYRSYAAGTTSLSAACQPMTFNADGTALLLQDGSLISVADGALLMSFETGEDGAAFEADLIAAIAQFRFPSVDEPVTLFSADLVVVNDRVFDAASGALLADLDVANVWGLALAEDGLTLYILTPAGIQQWQVLQ